MVAQLCQEKEDNLWSGVVTKEDHRKKFVSNDNEFFKALAQENKRKVMAVAMMEA